MVLAPSSSFENYTLIQRNFCSHIHLPSQYLLWMCHRHLKLKMCQTEPLVFPPNLLTTSQIVATQLLQPPKPHCGIIFVPFCFPTPQGNLVGKSKPPPPSTLLLSSTSHHHHLARILALLELVSKQVSTPMTDIQRHIHYPHIRIDLYLLYTRAFGVSVGGGTPAPRWAFPNTGAIRIPPKTVRLHPSVLKIPQCLHISFKVKISDFTTV